MKKIQLFMEGTLQNIMISEALTKRIGKGKKKGFRHGEIEAEEQQISSSLRTQRKGGGRGEKERRKSARCEELPRTSKSKALG